MTGPCHAENRQCGFSNGAGQGRLQTLAWTPVMGAKTPSFLIVT